MLIFIIEDDLFFAEILQQSVLFEYPNAIVKTFDNSTEALQAIQNELPNIITVDYNLPDIKGTELIYAIQAIEQNVPIIAISGQEDIATAVEMLKVGAFDYIVKNIDAGNRLNNAIRIIQERLELEAQIAKKDKQIKQFVDDITKSIQYGKNIQEAMLPSLSRIKKSFPNSFILFKPRDQISGDFYWHKTIEHNNQLCHIIAVFDCAGHGIPGALLSMIGLSILERLINYGVYQPNELLNRLHNEFMVALRQQETENKDGLDASVCMYMPHENKMLFAGANNPLYYQQASQDEIQIIRSDRMSVGGLFLDVQRDYSIVEIPITEPTNFYLFSDGFADQFGGPKNKKLKLKGFREMLQKHANKPMHVQEILLSKDIHDWQGTDNMQVDDITLIGFELKPIYHE